MALRKHPAWRVTLNYYVGGLILARIATIIPWSILTIFSANNLIIREVFIVADFIIALLTMIMAAYFGAWYINSRYVFNKTNIINYSLFYYLTINLFFLALLTFNKQIEGELITPFLSLLLFSPIYYFAGKRFIKENPDSI